VSKTVKVGIVGLGKMGRIREREIRSYPGAELVWGADADENACESLSDINVSQDFRDLVRSDVDAVFVCTPNYITPAVVTECLDAGKHVFCEKPPGRTIEDIHAIIEAEKRNPNLRLKFGFNHRYHAGIQEAKRLVDSGRFGDILWLRGIYGKSGGSGFEKEWRSDKQRCGGGILLDQGIHMVDLFRYFCGDFVEVKSMVTTAYWNIDVEDNAFALLRDHEGRVALLHSSSTQWKHRFCLEVYMSEGYLSVNGILSSTRSYGDETITVARKQLGGGHATGKPREETIYFDTDPSWEREVAEFFDSILNGAPIVFGTSEQALKAMQLVCAIYKDDDECAKERG